MVNLFGVCRPKDQHRSPPRTLDKYHGTSSGPTRIDGEKVELERTPMNVDG